VDGSARRAGDQSDVGQGRGSFLERFPIEAGGESLGDNELKRTPARKEKTRESENFGFARFFKSD
jgi:hypothetical protein